MTATPVVGPIPCQPWCEDGGGHRSAVFAGDQRCESPHQLTGLSLAEDPGPNWLNVFARQRPDTAATVCLHVYVNDIDHDVHLTPAEAREIAANLITVADEIEGVK